LGGGARTAKEEPRNEGPMISFQLGPQAAAQCTGWAAEMSARRRWHFGECVPFRLEICVWSGIWEEKTEKAKGAANSGKRESKVAQNYGHTLFEWFSAHKQRGRRDKQWHNEPTLVTNGGGPARVQRRATVSGGTR